MNTLNPTAAKATRCHAPLNPHRPSFSKLLSSFSVRFPPPPLHRSSLTTIKASLRHENPDKRLKLIRLQIDTPAVLVAPCLGPLRATVVTTITAAALLFSGLSFSLKPSIAAPISPPLAVETAEKDSFSDEEREKVAENYLLSNPSDVAALKNLMEIKINQKKVPEVIEILDKLIYLEPEDVEWPLLKAHIYLYNEEYELAKNIFNNLIKEDPFHVEAYHGLVSVMCQEESLSGIDLINIDGRVEEMMKLCLELKKKDALTDFKLLFAQIKILRSRFHQALEIYEELSMEDPRDFRPHLCKGIVYTIMRRTGVAEQYLKRYRRLVPKNHPYSTYLHERAKAKS